MNLKAYDTQGACLFGRQVKTKDQALKEVLNHGMLVRVAWVIYKGHKYTISQIYGGF